VDAWLTSAKCATKLRSHLGRAPVWVIDHRLEVDPALVDFVDGSSVVPLRPAAAGQAAGIATSIS
jgi:hypothetical protein